MSARQTMLSRRFLLRALVSAAAGLPLIGGAAFAKTAEGRALSALARLFHDRQSAVFAGRACAACGSTADRVSDLRALAADLGTTVERLPKIDRDVLRRRMSERVRADFGAGRVTRIKGWVLAETEVRLYTLVSIAA